MMSIAFDAKPTRAHFAFSFSDLGFQRWPGAGDVMAELVATGGTDTPLHDFRIDRFAGQGAIGGCAAVLQKSLSLPTWTR